MLPLWAPRGPLPETDWADMQDSFDDVDSPYFDWDNNRMFDESSRTLIDRIANDPRFYDWDESDEIIHELAPHKSEDEQENLTQAAWEVFERDVLPGLEARAKELVAQALADPNLDVLPVWHGEAAAVKDDFEFAYTDPDPRVVEEFRRRMQSSGAQQRLHDAALARAEREALAIVGDLPPRTLDSLVLANRNADREALLEPFIERPTVRRRGWIAYYAHKIARQEHEQSVLDRYSAATKILIGQGWSKQTVAQSIQLGVGRIDRLFDRPTGRNLADNDPLCELVPELRGRGDAWREASRMRAQKPKSFSRLSVDEKVSLAIETPDGDILIRLANQRSRRISEALINRHCQRGDVGDDVLQTVLKHRDWWVREKIGEAHRLRPLPKATALGLAMEDARLLLDCNDETALAAKSLGRADFLAALAVRESDVDTMQEILSRDSDSDAFKYLVDLLTERPLPKRMLQSSRLSEALLGAAQRTDQAKLAVTLRLIACQRPETLLQHIETANSGNNTAMLPEQVVAVALGGYHTFGSTSRSGVRASARALWAATEMTQEQRLARETVAKCGRESVTVESAGNVYIAAADAIRSFRKGEITQYTYVHMCLTPGDKYLHNPLESRMSSGLPALGYRKEMLKHPMDPDGPEVRAIVWPIPFEPAIYALDVGAGESAGLIAVSDSKVAIVEHL